MHTSRRFGAVLLFALWAQVATANALPCAVSCWMEIDTPHHHHHHDAGGEEQHILGHHVPGPKLSAPEHCGTPQLLVAAFTHPDFPIPPAIDVAQQAVTEMVPASYHSAVLEFATPPPRV